MIRIYTGGYGIEEDILYQDNGTKIFLPSQSTGIIAIKLEMNTNPNTTAIKQPEAIFYSQGRQVALPLRYAYFEKKFIDFGKGLEATAYIIPGISQSSQGISRDSTGAVIYISPRLMRGMLAQIYLLNDPFKNFTAFKIVHSEPNIIIDSLNSQGMALNEFTYFRGELLGPIKIWEIDYTGNEKVNPVYLETIAPRDMVSWEL